MKTESRKNSQKGLKLYTYLEYGKYVEFRKWLHKHRTTLVVGLGINEGCGSNKCSVLLKAASLPEVRWEEIMLLIDRSVQ